MTKPQLILKGKVKRLLREQEDMGQLGDSTVDACVSAVEAFVHDIGERLLRQAKATGVAAITPIEVKRTVLASDDLSFLHKRVQDIDESDVKYQKTAKPRKRKAADAAATKTPKKAAKKAEKAAAKPSSKTASKAASVASSQPVLAAAAAMQADIHEDDNYDSSDSD